MGPCPTTAALQRLLAEQLDEAEREKVAGHVDACPNCRQLLEALTNDGGEDLLSRLRERPGEPTPFLTTQLPNPLVELKPPAWPRLPGYEVLGELGSGGMGCVYKARQLSVNRLVALKVIRAASQARPEELARFRLEGEMLARVQHANVVPVYDVGVHDGQPYCAMEYVQGGTLGQWLLQARPSAREAAGLVETLARAAHAAHLCGIVHRDLKPANILLQRAESGEPRAESQKTRPDSALALCSPLSALCPKITDFGLAKCLTGSGRLTATGQVMGTPSYMAPEQATGNTQAISPRTDVYALGTILYELLTGRLPFEGDDPPAVLLQVVHQEPPPLRRWAPQVPRDLETICLKCLAKEPAQRYPTAEELAADLRRYANHFAIQARRAGPLTHMQKWVKRNLTLAAVGLVALLTVAVAGFFAWRAFEAERQRAAETQTEKRAGALDRAVTAALNGDHDRAEQEIAAAEALGAARGEVSKLRGIIALYRDQYREAITHLTSAEEALGPSVAVKSLLASAAWLAGDPRLLNLGGEALSLQPQTPEDFLFHGQLILAWDDPRKGLQEIEQAIGLKGSPVALLVRAQARSYLAVDTGAEEDARKALRDAEVVREYLPESNLALAFLLWARLQLWDIYEIRQGSGDRERATEHQLAAGELVKAVGLTPRGWLVSCCLHYWKRTGKESAARKYFQDLLDTTRDRESSRFRARLLVRLGEPKRALEAVAAAPETKILDPLLWVAVRAELGEGKEAYREVRDQPLSPTDFLNMGQIPLLLGEPAEARAHFQAMLDKRLVPPWHRGWYEALVRYGASAGGPDAEKALLDRAGASRLRQCEAHFLIGLRHLALGDRKQARRQFELVIRTHAFHYGEHWWADIFLAQMDADPAWPRWIPAEDKSEDKRR